MVREKSSQDMPENWFTSKAAVCSGAASYSAIRANVCS